MENFMAALTKELVPSLSTKWKKLNFGVGSCQDIVVSTYLTGLLWGF